MLFCKKKKAADFTSFEGYSADAPLLELRDFGVTFEAGKGQPLHAVDSVSLSVAPRQIVGVVGESGCGKSVMSQSIVRLIEHETAMSYTGAVLYKGVDLLKLPLSDMRAVRGKEIAVIFQDPQSSLNPVYSVGWQLREAVRVNDPGLSRKQADDVAVGLLEKVGIRDARARLRMYPHEFSGGMQQRVMIAMALASHPSLLIADEPTTALDATTQAQIVELLRNLAQSEDMAVLFISHDLDVVASLCSRVVVMYLGQVVEELPSTSLATNARHPYTQALLRSVPPLRGERRETLDAIPGQVPPLSDIPQGCRFAARCEQCGAGCKDGVPALVEVELGHRVRCGACAVSQAEGEVR
jgi:peptide/nickel transport system ATP-binding protein